jgi:biopolymer transport protein ExbB
MDRRFDDKDEKRTIMTFHGLRSVAALLVVAGALALAGTPKPAAAQATPAASAASAAETIAPAAVPVAPPALTAPVPPGREELENPYGLQAMWEHGDWVSKGVLLILLIMSAGTWYIFFNKLWEQRKLLKDARVSTQTFWNAPSVQQGIDGLDRNGAFHYIASEAAQATSRHSGLLERVDLNSWISMSIQRAIENVQSRLQDGLAFLATVGSTAPFIGLFGTVWGILNALTAIGVAGQASIDKVAGPVGEALIMTAMGLAVAVPAVLAYNLLVRRNKTAIEEVRGFGADLHMVLLSGGTAKRS